MAALGSLDSQKELLLDPELLHPAALIVLNQSATAALKRAFDLLATEQGE